jgi:hypothetical protein
MLSQTQYKRNVFCKQLTAQLVESRFWISPDLIKSCFFRAKIRKSEQCLNGVFSIDVASIKTPVALLKQQLFDLGMKEIGLTVSELFQF